MTVTERPLFGKVDIERVPSWSDYTTLESNPTAVSSGSAAAFGTRYSWVRTWVGNGAEVVLPFGTLARFTSPETGAVAGRGIDSYGNQDLASPLTTGDFIAGPTVTPGETITVSRWVRMNVPTPGYTIGVRFHNGAGAWLGGTSFSAYTGAGAGTSWVKPTWTGVVPAGATRYSVTLRVATVTVAATTFMDVSGLMTHKGAPSGPVSLAKATRCSITRGGSRTGLGIKTDVGLMSFTLHNDQDPLSGGVFEPGQIVRAVIPAKPDQSIYSHGFEVSTVNWPAQQVYTHGFEGYTETTTPAQEVYSHGFETYAETVTPASNVFTFGYETAADPAWTGVSIGRNDMSTTGNVGHTGNFALFMSDAVGAWKTASYVRTGLEVGRWYTFEAWVAGSNGTSYQAKLGVESAGGSMELGAVSLTGSYATAAGYRKLSLPFLADATSVTLKLSSFRTGGTTNFTAWDDISLTRNAYTTVTNDGTDGWTTYQTGSGSWSVTANSFSGVKAYTLDTPDAGHYSFRPPGLMRTVTGLEVGRTYNFSAFGRNRSGIPVGFGLMASGQSPDPLQVSSTTWQKINRTFTATATSMDIHVAVGPWIGDSMTTAPVVFDLDEIVLTRNAYNAPANLDMDGWLGTNTNARARTGTRSAAYGTGQSKTFTGLLVGHPYQLAGYYWNTSTLAWTQVTVNLTGSAGGNGVNINAPNASHWDDFTLTRTAWTQVTDNGLDSWTGLSGVVTGNAHSGTYSGATPTTTGVKTVTRNLTGLTPGGWYRVEGWVKGLASTQVSIEAGGGTSAVQALATANTYEKRVYEFKARTAAEAIAFKFNQALAAASYLDDIQVTRFYPATPIFTGTVTDVSSTYPFNKSTGEKRTSVIVTVSDAVKVHGTTPRYGAMIGAPYYETFEQRINRLAGSALAPIESPPVGAPKVVYAL